MIVVMFDLSAWVRYITRFTEEGFSVLISVIFIYEALVKLEHYWHDYPVHSPSPIDHEDQRCYCQLPVNNTSVAPFGNNTLTLPATPQDPALVWDSWEPPFVNDSLVALAVPGTGHGHGAVAVHQEPRNYTWSDLVDADCVTTNRRVLIDEFCARKSECLDRDWDLVGEHCNLEQHSIPDVFLLCFVLCIGTFAVAMLLRIFRGTRFFPSRVSVKFNISIRINI